MNMRRDSVLFIGSLILTAVSTFVLLFVVFSAPRKDQARDPLKEYEIMLQEDQTDLFLESLTRDLDSNKVIPDGRVFRLVDKILDKPYRKELLGKALASLKNHAKPGSGTQTRLVAYIAAEAGLLAESDRYLPGLLDSLPDEPLKIEARAAKGGDTPVSCLNLLRTVTEPLVLTALYPDQALRETYWGELAKAQEAASDRAGGADPILRLLISYDQMREADSAASLEIEKSDSIPEGVQSRVLDAFVMAGDPEDYRTFLARFMESGQKIPLEHLENARLLGLDLEGLDHAELTDPVREAIMRVLELPDALAVIPALRDIWIQYKDERALRLLLFYAFTLERPREILDVLEAEDPVNSWVSLYRVFLEPDLDVSSKEAASANHPLLRTYALLDQARKFYMAGRLGDSKAFIESAAASLEQAGARLGRHKLKAYLRINAEILAFKGRLGMLRGETAESRKNYAKLESQDPWHNQLFYAEEVPEKIQVPEDIY